MDDLNKQLKEILQEGCKIEDEIILNNDLLKKTLEECCCDPTDGLLITDLKNPIDDSVFSDQAKIEAKSEDDLTKSMDKLEQCLTDIDTKIANHKINIDGSVEIDNILYKLKEFDDLYSPVYEYHFELKNQIDVLLQKRQSYLNIINPVRAKILKLSDLAKAKLEEKDNYIKNTSSPTKAVVDQYQKEADDFNKQKEIEQGNLDVLILREKTEINSDVILSAEFNAQAGIKTREDILEQYINNLLSSSCINNLASNYAGNLIINSNNVQVTKNLTYEILFDYIKHNIDLNNNITTENLLQNQKIQKKTFLNGVANLSISQTVQGYKYSGVLYDKFYELFEDPINNFFTIEERGLTLDSSKIDADLKQDIENAKTSGIDLSNSVKIELNGKSFYIKDFEKYKEFNSTVQGKIDIRKKEIKESIVKPIYDLLITALKELANKQAKYIIAYGELFSSTFGNQDSIVNSDKPEINLNINKDLSSVINNVEQLVNSFKIGYTDLIDEIQRLELIKQDYSAKMRNFQADLTSVPCARKMEEVEEAAGAGIDPLGNISLKKGADITNPNPGKWCYWTKFAKIATLACLAPVPESPYLRYWPFGLVVPSPAGPKKIPLPCVFIPITVISSKLGTIVIFIAQCGILPCPLVFYISNTGVKKDILTLRGPSSDFGQPTDKKTVKDTIQLKYDKFKTLASGKLDKIGISKQDTELLEKSDKAPSFAEFKDELYSELEKKIDSIQLPLMTNFTTRKNNLGKGINNLSKNDKINLIKKDFAEYLDLIDLPTFELPKDKTKINPRKESGKGMSDLFKDFNSNKNTENIQDKLNLKTKILSEIDNVNVNDVQSDFTSVPITEENMPKIRKAWKKILNQSFDKIKNDKELAFTLLSIKELESINIAVPFVCKTEPVKVSTTIPSLAITTIIGFKVVIDQSLNLLTPTKIRQLTDLNILSVSKIKDSLKIIIDKLIPAQFLPNDLYNFSIQKTIQSSLKNINKISGSSFKLGSPQKELKIDMNKLKGPIKSGFGNSISVALKSFPLNINTSFDSFTAVDMKVLLKNTLRHSINTAANIFSGPYNAVNALSSIKKINLMDVTTGLLKSPSVGPEKGIKDNLTITDIESLNTAYKLLETTIIIPFIGALFMAGTGSGDVLRKVHPVLDYDDLPPWERLSLNNFIFMLFLDEFLHTNKQKNGF